MQYQITATSTAGETRVIKVFASSLSRADRIADKLTSYFDLGSSFVLKSYTVRPIKKLVFTLCNK